MVDEFSKVTMTHIILEQAIDVTLGALPRWNRVFGVPHRIATDGGRYFNNSTIRAEMKRLNERWHINTWGHLQGRGVVKRLHGTLEDHLRIFKL